MTPLEVCLAALPGHDDEDRATVEYLLAVLIDAGYTIVPPLPVTNNKATP